MSDPKRELLRHLVATVAYRGEKPITDVPEDFGDFKIGETTKTPLEILSHIGDLYAWALSQVEGKEMWREADAVGWNAEVDRFFETISKFDEYLASDQPIHSPLEKLMQGPIADSLTHVGQIAMLRRLADSPVRGENFFKADIRIGQVSKDQPAPTIEFD